ncbi:MAG: nucleoside-diphosphate sugar epimerase/dehydratase [Phycisphaerae bacterium]|jgi:FlaA1/EpsC-like NDP-sugar epimerase
MIKSSETNELASGQKSKLSLGRFAWVESLLLRHRLTFNLVVHAALFSLALLLANLARFEIADSKAEKAWFVNSYLAWLPLFVGLKLIVFGQSKLFRGGWQYASIRDVLNILRASLIFLAIMFVLIMAFRHLPSMMNVRVAYIGPFFASYPQGVLFLDFLASVFLVCVARLGFRIYREELRPVSTEGFKRVLVVGAGNAAEAIIREINRMPEERFRVAGLVDDDPTKRHMMIHGAPVLGVVSDLPQICQEEEIEEIIIAMPSASQKQLRHVIDLCSGTKLKFQSLPGVGDLIDGRVMVSQIRPVDINDLLGRQAVALDTDAVARFIANRRVLITGAGGSIGSEMCRQVCNFKPSALILLEQAENPLFDMENELRSSHPDIPVVACICDIFDRDRVMAIWEAHRPEVVIHAAAHKHVPLMENNPCEAVKNNILGTRNVADACCRFGSAEFVTISTDKAVNPSSVMGASKRVAEIYTQSLNGSGGCKTQFKAVRFGNVLGSAGSVVPTFRKQIAEGGPVRVTHPEMTRYFMTIPEASQLVLQAAATGEGGQIFLLDMGEPVKIMDLARQMITLSGFRPGEDIDIVVTGIRPGEKLFEELRTEGEDIQPTMHPKVLVWKSKPTDFAKVRATFERFESLRNSTDRAAIVDAIRTLVPEYEPRNAPTTQAVGGPASEPTPAAGTSGGKEV